MFRDSRRCCCFTVDAAGDCNLELNDDVVDEDDLSNLTMLLNRCHRGTPFNGKCGAASESHGNSPPLPDRNPRQSIMGHIMVHPQPLPCPSSFRCFIILSPCESCWGPIGDAVSTSCGCPNVSCAESSSGSPCGSSRCRRILC